MVNAYTGGASGAAWDNLVEAAFDRVVEWQLRDAPQWRQLIDKRPINQAMPGDTVTMTLQNDFTAHATTPLTETVDPDSVAAPAPTRVVVTLNEYGNAAISTLRLRDLGFTKPDQELAMGIGRNMYDTMDDLVRAIADAGTNIIHSNSGTLSTSGGTDVLTTTTDLMNRKASVTAVSLLRRNKIQPRIGQNYAAVIHPDVAFDLQAENSATAWVAPHVYGTDTEAIYSGAVGDYQGARYIQTTRTTITNTGATSGKVYSTYYFGKQALVSAEVEPAHIVIGPQVDKLKRFFPIGWYSLAGWSIYRPEALVTVRTCSSIAGL